MTLPVPISEYHNRVEKCRESARREGLDAVIAVSRSPDRTGHVRYLSNYYNPVSYNPSTNVSLGLGYTVVLIPIENDPVLIVGFPPNESGQEVATTDVRVYPFMFDFAKSIREVVESKGLKKSTIGVAGLDVISGQIYLEMVHMMPNVTFKNANTIIEDQRMIKSANEIRLVLAAAKTADNAIECAMNNCKQGRRESELAGSVAKFLLGSGAERVLWIDVKSGPRLNYPITWPMASSRKMRKGDLVFFDIGAACKGGYLFDVSRTTVLGKASRQQKELLALSYDMSREVIASCRPGLRSNELVKIAQEYINTERSKGKLRIRPHAEMTTYAGHGLGLEVERPQLTPEHAERLEENMVLSPEPGVVVPGLGSAAFEENILVTKRGGKLLTGNVHLDW